MSLPEHASPGERVDPSEPDSSGQNLTLREATERFEVSRITLRRKLAAGEIAGAHKEPSRKGDTWALPLASLKALGYRDRLADAEPEQAPAHVPPAAPSTPETGALVETVRRLLDTLDTERRALMAAESDRSDARIEAARLAAQLEAERDRRERAEAELDRLRETSSSTAPEQARESPGAVEPPRRARWWRRGSG